MVQAPRVSPVAAGLAGMGCGLVTAVFAFLPVMLLQLGLLALLAQNFGAVYDLPFPLLILFTGLPLPWALIFIVPAGGALLGLAGATAGLRRAQKKAQPARYQWRAALLWAAIAGAAVNLLVSFWAQ
jgi:hypothetical protein